MARERSVEVQDLGITPDQLAGVIKLRAGNTVGSTAADQLFELLCDSDETAEALADAKGLFQVSDSSQLDEWIDAAVEAHGPIEILINNAGVISDSLLMRMKDDQFEHTMGVNMYGTYYCTHKVITGMIKGRWGRIVNVSSVVGMRGNIGQSNYSASKAAVLGFTQSIAKEVATRGITVNVVAPGYITTATSADISDKQRNTVMTWIPQGRFGEPDEVAPTIVFLTTDEAQYITGDIIRVDGGMAI